MSRALRFFYQFFPKFDVVDESSRKCPMIGIYIHFYPFFFQQSGMQNYAKHCDILSVEI